ncbi:hypothetical protein D3C87_299020 [compost metagenome]
MCYHVSTPDKRRLSKAVPKIKIGEDLPGYEHVSGFERPFLYTTLSSDQETAVPSRWKLLPGYVKNEEEAKKYANTLNANSDGIFVTKSYSPFIERYKGLLWVEGFYEPHYPEGAKKSENYFIYRPGKAIFTLGIVYAPWVNRDTGEMINTFSIITTEATPQMAIIHNQKKRMPLIIGENQRSAWLNAHEKEEIQQFFVPYDGTLEAEKIETRVTGGKQKDKENPQGSLF